MGKNYFEYMIKLSTNRKDVESDLARIQSDLFNLQKKGANEILFSLDFDSIENIEQLKQELSNIRSYFPDLTEAFDIKVFQSAINYFKTNIKSLGYTFREELNPENILRESSDFYSSFINDYADSSIKISTKQTEILMSKIFGIYNKAITSLSKGLLSANDFSDIQDRFSTMLTIISNQSELPRQINSYIRERGGIRDFTTDIAKNMLDHQAKFKKVVEDEIGSGSFFKMDVSIDDIDEIYSKIVKTKQEIADLEYLYKEQVSTTSLNDKESVRFYELIREKKKELSSLSNKTFSDKIKSLYEEQYKSIFDLLSISNDDLRNYFDSEIEKKQLQSYYSGIDRLLSIIQEYESILSAAAETGERMNGGFKSLDVSGFEDLLELLNNIVEKLNDISVGIDESINNPLKNSFSTVFIEQWKTDVVSIIGEVGSKIVDVFGNSSLKDTLFGWDLSNSFRVDKFIKTGEGDLSELREFALGYDSKTGKVIGGSLYDKNEKNRGASYILEEANRQGVNIDTYAHSHSDSMVGSLSTSVFEMTDEQKKKYNDWVTLKKKLGAFAPPEPNFDLTPSGKDIISFFQKFKKGINTEIVKGTKEVFVWDAKKFYTKYEDYFTDENIEETKRELAESFSMFMPKNMSEAISEFGDEFKLKYNVSDINENEFTKKSFNDYVIKQITPIILESVFGTDEDPFDFSEYGKTYTNEEFDKLNLFGGSSNLTSISSLFNNIYESIDKISKIDLSGLVNAFKSINENSNINLSGFKNIGDANVIVGESNDAIDAFSEIKNILVSIDEESGLVSITQSLSDISYYLNDIREKLEIINQTSAFQDIGRFELNKELSKDLDKFYKVYRDINSIASKNGIPDLLGGLAGNEYVRNAMQLVSSDDEKMFVERFSPMSIKSLPSPEDRIERLIELFNLLRDVSNYESKSIETETDKLREEIKELKDKKKNASGTPEEKKAYKELIDNQIATLENEIDRIENGFFIDLGNLLKKLPNTMFSTLGLNRKVKNYLGKKDNAQKEETVSSNDENNRGEHQSGNVLHIEEIRIEESPQDVSNSITDYLKDVSASIEVKPIVSNPQAFADEVTRILNGGDIDSYTSTNQTPPNPPSSSIDTTSDDNDEELRKIAAEIFGNYSGSKQKSNHEDSNLPKLYDDESSSSDPYRLNHTLLPINIDYEYEVGDTLQDFIHKNVDKLRPINDENGLSSVTTTPLEQVESKLEEVEQQARETSTAIENVIYHSGTISKLNKAETNGRFYGSNRGTGYFGTGHYFVDSSTKHEIMDGQFASKPFTSVDISKYDNLFKANTDDIAGKLHSFLERLTKYTQGNDTYNIDELFSQFEDVFGKNVLSEEEFNKRLSELVDYMSKSSMYDRGDSVSTQFMKSLGYGGVDTRGTNYADTRYGTVIYDLKEESILQANITDELQKQGDMLDKISYKTGEVFDKSEDDRIQDIIDKQRLQNQIQEEYLRLAKTKNIGVAEEELDQAENRLKEINNIINNCQRSIENAESDAKSFLKDMVELDLISEDEITPKLISETANEHRQNYQETIDELSEEKTILESQIPILKEKYELESKLAQEIYEQAKNNVLGQPDKNGLSSGTAAVLKEEQKEIEKTTEDLKNLKHISKEVFSEFDLSQPVATKRALGDAAYLSKSDNWQSAIDGNYISEWNANQVKIWDSSIGYSEQEIEQLINTFWSNVDEIQQNQIREFLKNTKDLYEYAENGLNIQEIITSLGYDGLYHALSDEYAIYNTSKLTRSNNNVYDINAENFISDDEAKRSINNMRDLEAEGDKFRDAFKFYELESFGDTFVDYATKVENGLMSASDAIIKYKKYLQESGFKIDVEQVKKAFVEAYQYSEYTGESLNETQIEEYIRLLKECGISLKEINELRSEFIQLDKNGVSFGSNSTQVVSEQETKLENVEEILQHIINRTLENNNNLKETVVLYNLIDKAISNIVNDGNKTNVDTDSLERLKEYVGMLHTHPDNIAAMSLGQIDNDGLSHGDLFGFWDEYKKGIRQQIISAISESQIFDAGSFFDEYGYLFENEETKVAMSDKFKLFLQDVRNNWNKYLLQFIEKYGNSTNANDILKSHILDNIGKESPEVASELEKQFKNIDLSKLLLNNLSNGGSDVGNVLERTINDAINYDELSIDKNKVSVIVDNYTFGLQFIAEQLVSKIFNIDNFKKSDIGELILRDYTDRFMKDFGIQNFSKRFTKIIPNSVLTSNLSSLLLQPNKTNNSSVDNIISDSNTPQLNPSTSPSGGNNQPSGNDSKGNGVYAKIEMKPKISDVNTFAEEVTSLLSDVKANIEMTPIISDKNLFVEEITNILNGEKAKVDIGVSGVSVESDNDTSNNSNNQSNEDNADSDTETSIMPSQTVLSKEEFDSLMEEWRNTFGEEIGEIQKVVMKNQIIGNEVFESFRITGSKGNKDTNIIWGRNSGILNSSTTVYDNIADSKDIAKKNKKAKDSFDTLSKSVKEYIKLLFTANRTEKESERLVELQGSYTKALNFDGEYAITTGEGDGDAFSSYDNLKKNLKTTNVIDGVVKEFRRYESSLKNITSNSSKYTNDVVSSAEKILELLSVSDQFLNGSYNFIDLIAGNANKEQLDSFKSLVEYISKIRDGYSSIISESKSNNGLASSPIALSKLREDIADFISKNGKMSREAKKSLQQIVDEIYSIDDASSDVVSKLFSRFYSIKAEVKESGKLGKSFIKEFTSAISSKNAQFLAQYFSFQDFIRYIRQAITYVQELDTALTELRVVSNKTSYELNDVAKESYKVAKEIGSMTSTVIESITSWSRLGYSIEDAQTLAKQASILATGGFMETSVATEALTSTIQAFDEITVNSISTAVDDFIYVGNNFAITSEELATSLEKSSAALVAAGNSFNEVQALEVAGNAILQDSDTVANALKVLSMRLRGTSAKEIEEEGEDVEGLVEDASKLYKTVKDLTKTVNNPEGVSIINQTTGAYKSTYEILRDIAKVYDDMSDTNQAALLETIAGKTRGAAAAAILQNVDILEDVYTRLENGEAVGAGATALEESLDSIQVKITQFQNELQNLANDFVSSGFIKGVVDIGTALVSVLDKLIDKLGTFTTIAATLSVIGIAKGKFIFNPNFVDSLCSKLGNLVQVFSLLKKQTNAIQVDTSDVFSGFNLDGVDFSMFAPKPEDILSFDDKVYKKYLLEQLKNVGRLDLSQLMANESIESIETELGSILGEKSYKDKLRTEFSIEIANKQKLKRQLEDEMESIKDDAAKNLKNLQVEANVGHGVSYRDKNDEYVNSLKNEEEAAKALQQTWEDYNNELAKKNAVNSANSSEIVSKLEEEAAARNSLNASYIGQIAMSSNLSIEEQALTRESMNLLMQYDTQNISLKTLTKSQYEYLMGLIRVKVTTGEFSTEQAIAAERGLQLAYANTAASKATMLLKQAMLGIGITAIVWGLTKVYELIKKNSEAAKEASKATAELTNAYNSALKEVREMSDDVEELTSKYNKLSSGVDSLGNNVSLTTDEFTEYNNVVNEIADMFPDLISGYTDEGTAIVNLTDKVNGLSDAYKNAQIEAYKTIILGGEDSTADGNSIIKNWKGLSKNSGFFGKESSVNKKYQYAENAVGILSEVLSDENYFNTDDGMNRRSNLSTYLKSIDVDYDIDKIVGGDKEYIASIKRAVDMQKETYEKEIDSALNGVRSLAEAYLNVNPDYAKLSEGNQKIAGIIVNGLTSDIANGFEDKFDVDIWTSQIIAMLTKEQTDNPQIANALSGLFTLDVSSMPFDEAKNAMDVYISALEDYMAENYPEIWSIIKEKVGYAKVTSEYNQFNEHNKSIASNSRDKRGDLDIITEYTASFSREQQELWMSATRGAKNAANAISLYEEALTNIEPETTSLGKWLSGKSGVGLDKLFDTTGDKDESTQTWAETIDEYKSQIGSLEDYLEKFKNGTFEESDFTSLMNDFQIDAGGDVDKAKQLITAQMDDLTNIIIESLEEQYNKAMESNDEELASSVLHYINSLKEFEKKAKNITSKFAVSKNAKQDIEELKNGMDQLDTIYADMKDGNDFDFSNFIGNADFENTFGSYEEEYNKFMDVIAESGGKASKKTQDAFDKLATAYIYGSTGLYEVTEATKKSTIVQLKQMGVINAEKLVQNQLNAIELARAAGIDDITEATIGEIDAAYNNMSALIAEGDASNYTLAQLFNLIAKTKIFANQDLSTNDKIKELENLAKGFGLTASAANAAGIAIRNSITSESINNEASRMVADRTSKYYGNFNGAVEYLKGKYYTSEEDTLSNIWSQMEAEFAKLYGTVGSPVDYGGGKQTSSAENSKETLDWIETMIQRLEREITNLGTVASGTWRSWEERGKALNSEISKTTDELKLQADAYETYMAKANSINLSESYKEKVRNGKLQIEDIYDDNLKKAISEYKEYYEKALACEDATLKLRDALADLARQGFDAILSKADDATALISHFTEMIQKEIEAVETVGNIAGKTFYEQQIANNNDYINTKKQAKTDAENKLREALNNGSITYGSQAYWEMMKEIFSLETDIADKENENLKLAESIADVWTKNGDSLGKQYDNAMSLVTGRMDLIDGVTSLIETSGHIASGDYYTAQLAGQQAITNVSTQKRDALQKNLEDAIASGAVKMYDDRWYEMMDSINNANKAVIDSAQKEVELTNKLNELDKTLFDLMNSRINSIYSDNEYIRKLLKFDDDGMNYTRAQDGTKLYDGTFNKNGISSLGTILTDIATNQAQKEAYRARLNEVNEKLKTDPNNTKLLEEQAELTKAMQELDTQRLEYMEAIKNELQTLYDSMLSSIQYLTDQYKENLQLAKDTYDYQKQIQKLTDSRDNIQKQLIAFSGDFSEEGAATIQNLQKQLDEANEELKETEYERWIQDTEKLLDNMNEHLKAFVDEEVNHLALMYANAMNIVGQSITDGNDINKNINDILGAMGGVISTYTSQANESMFGENGYLRQITTGEFSLKTLGTGIADGVMGLNTILTHINYITGGSNGLGGLVNGIKVATSELPTSVAGALSTSMSSIVAAVSSVGEWLSGEKGFGIIDNMNTFLQNDLTTAIGLISTRIKELQTALPGIVSGGGGSNNNGGSGQAGDTGEGGNGGNGNGSNDTDKTTSGTEYTYEKVVDQEAGWYVFRGEEPNAQQGGIRYSTQKEAMHAAEESSKSDPYSNYHEKYVEEKYHMVKTPKKYYRGAHNLAEDQIAWTQEYGAEAIISPTSGAVLTPLKAGDSVLTAAQTENLYNLAKMSPSQLMKGNNLLSVVMPNTNGSSSTINSELNMTLSLPNVSNYSDFISQIKTDKQFEKIVQAMTIDKALGKNGYSKMKY